MSWTILFSVVAVLGLALLAAVSRRKELRKMATAVRDRDQAERQGSAKAQLQHPVVDLSRCLGCATCVASCPEDGVLDLVHGQAAVVNGARCIGFAACETACPVGAIEVTLGDTEERRDIPALSGKLEAVGSPGVFLAGEITAHALIKTAVDQGAAVGAEIARRVRVGEGTGAHREAPSNRLALVGGNGNGARPTNGTGPAQNDFGFQSGDRFEDEGAAFPGEGDVAEPNDPANETLDLVIVGAGPAGLSCSLEARKHGLRFVTLDQESAAGGTVARYPRRKLVMTHPLDMPLVGRLDRTSYTKEELIGLWRSIATRYKLPIRCGEVFVGVDRNDDGTYTVRTESGAYNAKHVVLAVGRRGRPRKLDVPGEHLPKVAYGLMDAHDYKERRVLVVGGGDTAIEAAIGLAEQPGNQVTISYRRESFFRIRAKNEERLNRALRNGALEVVFDSDLTAITNDTVELAVGPEGPNGTRPSMRRLPNDDVFIMAGAIAPIKLLEKSGVSFDPAMRPATRPPAEQGTGLVRALSIGFGLSVAALAFALGHADYYMLAAADRPAHPKHTWLRPGLGLGLMLGVTSAVLVVVNLLYLVRRSARNRFNFGSLKLWMTSHVATGILAFLCALLHAAMAPRNTVGGHAFWAMVALVVSGALGRYFYAWVPRAANGRELELGEVKAELAKLSEPANRDPRPGRRRFHDRARKEVLQLIESTQWRRSLLGRIRALVGVEHNVRRLTAELAKRGRSEGVPERELRQTLRLARRAHQAAVRVAHFEDLRALLAGWRYLHRWVAALMVLLIVVHVIYALAYGAFFFGRTGV